MSKQGLTRRAFLAATTTSAVAVSGFVRANDARVVPGKISPNEKINVVGIGVGGKGMGDISSCRRENVIALCDPDSERAGEAFYRFKDAKKYVDYRKMFDEIGDQIDACTISTPDHTHAPAAFRAISLGKHVYVQKPLTHTIAEARMLKNLAKEKGVITQMGNQGHCGDGVRELCEMMWSGAIGDVTEAHIWTNRPIWPQGITEPLPEETIPGTLDYDLWIGTAPMRPYNKGYVPWNWRAWWDFGCGAIGDMACHIMDPAFWSLKLYEAESYKIQAMYEEGMNNQTGPNKSQIKYQFPARGDMPPVTVTWYDGGIKPPRPESVPEGQQLGDGDNGSLFIGTTGCMTAGEYGGKARLLPDEKMADYTMPDQTIPRIPKESPYQNWLDCIRSGEQPASNFSYAAPLTEVANMGNVALHSGGKELEVDVINMRITNIPEANQLLTKEYRKGWELPC
jgi:predicted dehydrogenase